MANYNNLKSAVQAVIKENGNNEITGGVLQNVLLTILTNLSTGALFKGFASPSTNPGSPDENLLYMASEPGVYNNFNAIELEENKLGFFSNTSGAWVLSTIEMPKGKDGIDGENANFTSWSDSEEYSGNGVYVFYNNNIYELKDGETATSLDVPGVSNKWVLKVDVESLEERTPLLSNDDDLFHFQDLEGALVMVIDKDGNVSFYPTEKTKNEINVIKREDINGFVFAILDHENKILFGIRDNGDIVPNIQSGGGVSYYNVSPYDLSNGLLQLERIETIKEFISLPATAIGRETAEGADDAPEIPLTIGGYTHPSVLFVGSGWNGFRYWMAITPTFGIIAQQPDSEAYENPFIFCSNDGINWQQPNGIINPIDTPPHAPFPGYWSDTHLMLLPDGYLYCIYRGNAMPNKKLGISENPDTVSIIRADVCKRSKDGVVWDDFMFIQGTNNPGLNGNGGIMSPAFVFDDGYINCFDVVWSTPQYPYVGEGQYDRIVMRRLSKDLEGFKTLGYDQKNVVNFKNRPWQENHDVWHLDAHKWGNTWFLLLNTSQTNLDTGSDLYLAYSGDGWNYNVIEQPLALSTSYRSCIVPLSYNSETIEFLLFNNFKTDGSTFLKKVTLK